MSEWKDYIISTEKKYDRKDRNTLLALAQQVLEDCLIARFEFESRDPDLGASEFDRVYNEVIKDCDELAQIQFRQATRNELNVIFDFKPDINKIKKV